MADKPILFSGPMVRALLAGTKTQTRRAINPQMGGTVARLASPGSVTWDFVTPGNPERLHGSTHLRIKVGDRLYVREHWRINKVWDAVAPRDLGDIGPIHYEADQGLRYFTGKFRQGMHMPRRFSRITLTVTDARVQRLQEISEEDAKAEGVDFNVNGGPDNRAAYCRLWNDINGAGSWDTNPWVAAYTFTVERRNIDQAAAA